ncbi:hypothetical protein NL676_031432 [Syzygium grande]|nr:hypothetical protein NL676_031432 [Syzygium grande]
MKFAAILELLSTHARRGTETETETALFGEDMVVPCRLALSETAWIHHQRSGGGEVLQSGRPILADGSNRRA